MRRLTQVALLLAALSLAACSSTDKPKPTPLAPVAPQIGGAIVWQAKVDSIKFPLAIAATADAFFVGGSDGSLLALDAGSGRERWRAQAGAPLSAGVGSDGRFTSVVTRDNVLVVFEEGQERWRKKLAARVLTAPLVAGERVFVLRVDRVVQAFDALDGRPLWSMSRPGDALTLAQSGVVAAYRNLLLVGQGAKLVALEPTRGTLRWEVALATPRGTNEVERLADMVGPLTRIGDTVCARAFQSTVGCVNAERGSLTWSRPQSGAQALGGDGELLVGADASGRVTAWRTPSGEVAWTQQGLLYRELSGALVLGPVVVFGDLEGHVHFLSRIDGSTQLRLPTDGTPVVGTPVLAGNTLLVATRAGGLFAIRP